MLDLEELMTASAGVLGVVCSYGNGLISSKSGSGVNPTGLFDSSIFLNVIDILFVGTAGTQCLATSAPLPLSTRTDLKQKK
jgi:hypothetical protein